MTILGVLLYVFLGIEPRLTLGEIKQKFPYAKFERIEAAWVTENDAFFRMTGKGIDGAVMLAFDDPRPRYEREAQREPPNADVARSIAKGSDDDTLTIRWVRWIPSAPFPPSRLIERHGAPDTKWRSDIYQLHLAWDAEGILAALDTETETMVENVEFSFTKADKCRADLRFCSKVVEWVWGSTTDKRDSCLAMVKLHCPPESIKEIRDRFDAQIERENREKKE